MLHATWKGGIHNQYTIMTEFIFTFTSVTALVLLAYSVEQLGLTYTPEIEMEMADNAFLDEIGEY